MIIYVSNSFSQLEVSHDFGKNVDCSDPENKVGTVITSVKIRKDGLACHRNALVN